MQARSDSSVFVSAAITGDAIDRLRTANNGAPRDSARPEILDAIRDALAGLNAARYGRSHTDAQDLDRILMVGRRLIHSIEGLPLAGRLWIVDEAAIRIRPGD